MADLISGSTLRCRVMYSCTKWALLCCTRQIYVFLKSEHTSSDNRKYCSWKALINTECKKSNKCYKYKHRYRNRIMTGIHNPAHRASTQRYFSTKYNGSITRKKKKKLNLTREILACNKSCLILKGGLNCLEKSVLDSFNRFSECQECFY